MRNTGKEKNIFFFLIPFVLRFAYLRHCQRHWNNILFFNYHMHFAVGCLAGRYANRYECYNFLKFWFDQIDCVIDLHHILYWLSALVRDNLYLKTRHREVEVDIENMCLFGVLLFDITTPVFNFQLDITCFSILVIFRPIDRCVVVNCIGTEGLNEKKMHVIFKRVQLNTRITSMISCIYIVRYLWVHSNTYSRFTWRRVCFGCFFFLSLRNSSGKLL